MRWTGFLLPYLRLLYWFILSSSLNSPFQNETRLFFWWERRRDGEENETLTLITPSEAVYIFQHSSLKALFSNPSFFSSSLSPLSFHSSIMLGPYSQSLLGLLSFSSLVFSSPIESRSKAGVNDFTCQSSSNPVVLFHGLGATYYEDINTLQSFLA